MSCGDLNETLLSGAAGFLGSAGLLVLSLKRRLANCRLVLLSLVLLVLLELFFVFLSFLSFLRLAIDLFFLCTLFFHLLTRGLAFLILLFAIFVVSQP